MWQGSVKASELDPITPVLCSRYWVAMSARLQDLIVNVYGVWCYIRVIIIMVCLPSGVKKDTARLSQSFKVRPYHYRTVLTLLAASDRSLDYKISLPC